jgi:hypothetical protein
MKLKAIVLALFVAGLGASYALAGPPPGKGKGRDKAAPAAASTTTAADKKAWVCHKAGNSGKYVKVHVSKNAVKARLKHHDVMPDAAGNCPAPTAKTGGDDDDKGDDEETTTTSTTPTTGSTESTTTTNSTP